MPAVLPSASPSSVRSLLRSLPLLVLAAPPLAPVASAETLTLSPVPAVERTRAHRPISDDLLLDRYLVAAVTGTKPLPTRFDPEWPTTGVITTYFGEVGNLSPHGHTGLDVAGPVGTPILAVDEGAVIKAAWSMDGYGGLVIVAHTSGYETWYAHLSRFEVAKGQRVKRGERIARMGSTGYSTGSHLHFEVREGGQLRDPLSFLKEPGLQPTKTA